MWTDPSKERLLLILSLLAFWAWVASAVWAVSTRTTGSILINQALALVVILGFSRVILSWRDW